MTEDYVSFETAKLLKEKGFDEPCEGFYVNSGVLSHTLSNANNSKWDEEKYTIGYISAPSLGMAMKWLRKKRNLYIDPYPEDNSTWCLIIWKLYPKYVNQCKGKYDDYSYSTYEEACEAAIRYCLENLI